MRAAGVSLGSFKVMQATDQGRDARRRSGFVDRFPEAPRILFVGAGDSSHEHSWIELLSGAGMNVRLFARHGEPPRDFDVPTYVAGAKALGPRTSTRRRLYSQHGPLRVVQSSYARFVLGNAHRLGAEWLARVIRQWRPDVIHSFGLHASGHFVRDVRRHYGLDSIGTWIVQTRGGSDFELARLVGAEREAMSDTLTACDQVVCDNHVSYAYARELGAREDQISPLGPIPGTGGIDLSAVSIDRIPPSRRRVIVWPKAYDSAWSRSLPVIEALSQCAGALDGFELHTFATCDLTRQWLRTLPESLLGRLHVHDRVARAELLSITSRARMSIGPSLVDGVPNTMIEAMALGAMPIVSPLETIRPIVEHERNALFARNLYPEEIGAAAVRAASDDVLVDEAAERNLAHVATFADRAVLRRRVVEYYESLIAAGSRIRHAR
jgi:glycosyltransferase involved in cell wall biosynthesis